MVLVGKPDGENLEDIGIGWRIRVKWIFMKWGGKAQIG
jgi:hypothetical protein